VKSVIVGTAGHIDHGKTALVKALTGIDADRLAEEKRRGITIDLGFAHLELSAPSGERIRFGFVDVPGHERFVRNMLAGVGGIDLVLLVIAADEGIKPQTREHFEICRLLRIPRGITVLTKSDTVDAETLEVVRLEVEDFVRGSFLDTSQAPIVSVSTLKGTGLDLLKKKLVELAETIPARHTDAITRLPIDRVFVMKGHGTVVTGTLISGAIHKEDALQVFASGRRVRVRNVQVHGQSAERAIAGERTALNLAGIESADLTRGMMLVAPDLVGTTTRADVSLTLLQGARPLKNRSRVHVHCYAAESVAEVGLYECSELKSGETAFAQLRLADPLQLLPGDRFIIRQFSPVITIGGGEVLDATPLRVTRIGKGLAVDLRLQPEARSAVPSTVMNKAASAAEGRAFFVELLSRVPERILLARIRRREIQGLPIPQAVYETGWPPAQIDSIAQQLIAEKKITRAGVALCSAEHFGLLQQRALAAIENFHRHNPLLPAMPREQLREQLAAPAELVDAALHGLHAAQKVTLTGEHVRLAGHGVVMKDEEAAAKERIEKAFASAGLKVPLLKEVMASLPVDRLRAQKLLTLLLRDRVLVKLGDDLVFHRAALDQLRTAVQQHKQRSTKIDVGTFKELTGVSRKYAIPLLEYLDRERITRRVGDERVIL
jgi:selenocysteine-specific elongation factor